MTIDFNNIERALYHECELEKIMRNNVVLWQAYVNIIITLHSNNELKDIYAKLYGQTAVYKDIDVTLNSQTSTVKDISIILHADVDYYKDALTFIAVEPNSTVQFTMPSPTISVDYLTKDNDWTLYSSNTIITLQNINDTVSFRATTTNDNLAYNKNFSKFLLNGKLLATGNVMSLLDKDCRVKTVPANCFTNLFKDQIALVGTPYIDADTIDMYGCTDMFENCINITRTCQLSAKINQLGTYYNMFKGCIRLTDASNITILDDSSEPLNFDDSTCAGMFEDCISLVKPPVISSTMLYTNCYRGMFSNCSSLTMMPTLPATSLHFWSNGCYDHMFYGCTSLSSTDGFKLDGNDPGCVESTRRFRSMFEGCSNISSFVTTFNFNGHIDNMFKNCTSLKYVETGMTNMANSQYSHWLKGTLNTPECLFKCPNALSSLINLFGRSDSTVPSNWRIWYNSEPEPPKILYTELEYILSDGNQWIDTEFKPCASTQYVVKYTLADTCTTVWPSVFGTRSVDVGRYTIRYYNDTTSTNGFFLRSASPTGSRYDIDGLSQSESVGKTITCKLIDNLVYADDILYGTFETPTNDDEFPYSLYLFAVNSAGVVEDNDRGTNIRIHQLQLLDKNDVLLCNIIPILLNDGTACMYDTVRGKFLYNIGTGSFIPGPPKTTNINTQT